MYKIIILIPIAFLSIVYNIFGQDPKVGTCQILYKNHLWDITVQHETDIARVYIMTNPELPFPIITSKNTVITTVFEVPFTITDKCDGFMKMISVKDEISEVLYFYMFNMPEGEFSRYDELYLIHWVTAQLSDCST